MIAHAIHYNSPRAKKPFIKVSAAAFPESLIESEPDTNGAFTGAQAAKKGRFELAEGGTLFLDEIGDLNPTNPSRCACCRSARSSVSAARHPSRSTSGDCRDPSATRNADGGRAVSR